MANTPEKGGYSAFEESAREAILLLGRCVCKYMDPLLLQDTKIIRTKQTDAEYNSSETILRVTPNGKRTQYGTYLSTREIRTLGEKVPNEIFQAASDLEGMISEYAVGLVLQEEFIHSYAAVSYSGSNLGYCSSVRYLVYPSLSELQTFNDTGEFERRY